jgi:hypothetical protein
MLFGGWIFGTRGVTECLDVDANPYLGRQQLGGVSITFCLGDTLSASLAYNTDVYDGPLDIKNVGFVDGDGRVAFVQATRNRFVAKRENSQEWHSLHQQVHFDLPRTSQLPKTLRNFSTIRLDIDGDKETIEIAFTLPEQVRTGVNSAQPERASSTRATA